MIIPKFNAKRLGNSDAIGNAINSLAKPVAKFRDKKTKLDVDAANKNLIDRQRRAEAAWRKKKAAEKKAKEEDKKNPVGRVVQAKRTPTVRVTKAGFERQKAAAATYITTRKRGEPPLTPAQKAQNAAARSYMKPFKPEAPKGRPNSGAVKKILTPKAPSTPKATVNKTPARKTTPVKRVVPVTKPKMPSAPGRRKNGAPK